MAKTTRPAPTRWRIWQTWNPLHKSAPECARDRPLGIVCESEADARKVVIALNCERHVERAVASNYELRPDN